jgi:hypothetical protein
MAHWAVSLPLRQGHVSSRGAAVELPVR